MKLYQLTLFICTLNIALCHAATDIEPQMPTLFDSCNAIIPIRITLKFVKKVLQNQKKAKQD